MLDIKFIAENVEELKKAVEVKRESIDIEELLSCHDALLNLKRQQQSLQETRNKVSKSIPKASAQERPGLIQESKRVGSQLDELRPQVSDLEARFNELMLQVPNIPSPLAPVGASEDDNVVMRKVGDIPKPSYKLKSHIELLEENGWAEFKRVADVCGSRSYGLLGEMVLYEQAVLRLAMDVLHDRGFKLVSMPSLVREHALVGTGHFPNGKDQVYHLPEDDLYLSGTAEVQINGLYGKSILDHKELPMKFGGMSPCFRREAGSYGRDVKGLIRVHQFLKVEQYILCENDAKVSEEWHQSLLQNSEDLLGKLEIPYQVIECCTGDMGAGKVRMFDIESWVPSEETYRETHSCSQLGDWQARRTGLRYRDGEGTVRFCHTLNNTAIASPRILVPLLENHQTEDGRVRIPEALRPYMGGREFLSSSR